MIELCVASDSFVCALGSSELRLALEWKVYWYV